MWQPLNGRGAESADVGSKAASLDRLVAANVDVPPAAALVVTAYSTYVEVAGLGDFLAGLPVRVQLADMADDVRRVEQAFLEAPLPPPVRDAINDAYRYVGGDGAVAVRSSATAAAGFDRRDGHVSFFPLQGRAAAPTRCRGSASGRAQACGPPPPWGEGPPWTKRWS